MHTCSCSERVIIYFLNPRSCSGILILLAMPLTTTQPQQNIFSFLRAKQLAEDFFSLKQHFLQIYLWRLWPTSSIWIHLSTALVLRTTLAFPDVALYIIDTELRHCDEVAGNASFLMTLPRPFFKHCKCNAAPPLLQQLSLHPLQSHTGILYSIEEAF